MSEETEKRTPLQVAQDKRAARKAQLQLAADAQKAIDLDAIDGLEQQYGDTNVGVLHIPHTPGLPSVVACKVPTGHMMKRYRDSVRPSKNGTPPDYVTAGELLATSVQIYPDAEAYEKLCAARPGLHLQLGMKALELATASEAAEGKS